MRRPRNRPSYTGITGFMSPMEVGDVIDGIEDAMPKNTKLMVGVLASSKTLELLPNRRPNRYPKADRIGDIFVSHPLVLNLIHYTCINPVRLFCELKKMTKIGGENLHGFQLNMLWPDPVEIARYKQLFPDKLFVLRCGTAEFGSVGDDMEMLISLVSGYEGLCEYLLLDPSGGEGSYMNPYEMLNHLRILREKIDGTMKFVVSGGLCAETAEDIDSLLREFPGLGCDAEGNLRDQNDHLVVSKAVGFVRKVQEIAARHQP